MTNVTPDNKYIFTNKAKCRDCYRCLRNCPVKAIKMENGQAYVIEEKCILCGTCIKECPQNAKSYRKDYLKVNEILGKETVVLSLAPSYLVYFDDKEILELPSILKQAGFSFISETSVGAEYTAKKTAENIAKTRERICSSCPALVNFVEKYSPENFDKLVSVVSPMIAHGKHLRAKLGNDIKIVFVSPCIAKKEEAELSKNTGIIDFVLTFEELESLIELNRDKIKMDMNEYCGLDEYSSPETKTFPVEGGITHAAKLDTDLLSLDTISASGFDNVSESLEYLADNENIIIDGLICKHGCINGPTMNDKFNIYQRRKRLLEKKNDKPGEKTARYDFDLTTRFKQSYDKSIEIDDVKIKELLKKTGKEKKEDQLDCGACGYDSCYHKAKAVVEGMADIDICIPYMRKLAEQRTDKIIESTPNGVAILDYDLNIVHMNPAFKRMFSCTDSLVGKRISRVIDPESIVNLIDSDSEKTIERTVHYEKYNLICHKIFYKLIEENQIVCIFVDITKTVNNQKKLKQLKTETILQAQELLDHQIEMAQKITKLLGESSAKGEILVDKLLKLSQEKSSKKENNSDWLWDIYTTK